MTMKHRLIGLTGTNGAGKGECAAYLKSRGYAPFSLSDILREELEARRMEITRDNLIRVGNELREAFGSDVLARRTAARIEGPAVIDSIRNTREVEYFRTQPGFILLALDAPIEIRYQRAVARGRNESALNINDFRKKEEQELQGGDKAQQLAACMALADRLIVNDGTLEELHKKLEDLL